ncbi:MAG: tRNA pseudouridine(55) synthase TruB [Lachnospiraceae bacterium]|nr:tRNA pseudouridine(55) synthase TruB [Lachnospiraceae bacterium]
MINGIMNIYKEAGFTSHDVVAKLRGIVGQKKIGHTGTLDPDAVGVLPVCFGNATKLCDMLTDKSKEYEVCMLLGVTTDTQDMSGRVLEEREPVADEKAVAAAIMSFVGGYEQIPPMYSALKVNGKRLYELARQGIEVERKPRHVDIPDIRIINVDLPRVRFAVECSKGTYIRSLCADIGERLGCGAAMETLVRTRVGGFRIEDALTLSDVERLIASGEYEKHVIAPDCVFTECRAAVAGNESAQRALCNGNKLAAAQLDLGAEENAAFEDGERLRVYDTRGEFKALYAYVKAEACFKPLKMFL